MNIPKSLMPYSEIKLPVSGQKLKVRAITTREEKVLLVHKEAGDLADIDSAIKDLIVQCCDREIDINVLSIPDLVALFLKIIEMSHGSIVTHEYICQKEMPDGTRCGETITTDIDISKVTYSQCKFPTNIVDLSDTLHVQMKRLNTEIISRASEKDTNNVEFSFWLVAYSIESIITGEDLYNEFTPDECYEWIMDLPITMSEKLLQFTQDIPTATLKHTVVCPKCGNTVEIELHGLTDFFPRGILDMI